MIYKNQFIISIQIIMNKFQKKKSKINNINSSKIKSLTNKNKSKNNLSILHLKFNKKSIKVYKKLHKL